MNDEAVEGPAATALIAEDEPLLAEALRLELARAWPRLRVLATVGDGVSAVARALELRPDVLFFDIRMPALGGLDAAAELADAWDDDAATRATPPFAALVFVTAYDEYATAAFETRAIDYLLKPVQPARLQKSVKKCSRRLCSGLPTPLFSKQRSSGSAHCSRRLRQRPVRSPSRSRSRRRCA